MSLLLFSLGLLSGAQELQLPQQPDDVLPAVERAVADGDTLSLTGHFERLAARELDRPLGRLGLATLDLFAFRYEPADAALTELSNDHAGDAVGVWATYTLALGSLARGMLGDASTHLELAAARARAISDSTVEALSLISLGALAARNRGPAASIPYLDRADELRHPDDRRTATRLLCARALAMLQLREPNVLDWIEQGEERAADHDLRGRAVCAHARAVTMVVSGDLLAADQAFDEAQTLFEQAGDLGNLGSILQWKGWNEWNAGYYVGAYPHLHRAVTLARRTGNESVIGWASANLAQIAVTFNDHSRAAMYLDQARDAFALTADTAGLRAVANVAATHLGAIGAYDAADSILQQLVVFADGQGIVSWSMGLRGNWTEMRIRQGDLAGAATKLAEAREAIERGQLQGWSGPLDRLAAYLALRRGDLDEADRQLDRAERFYDPADASPRYTINALRAVESLMRNRPDEAYAQMLAGANQLEQARQALSIDELRSLVFQGGGLAQIADASTAAVIAGLVEHSNVAGAYEIAERRRGRELLDRTVLARSMSDGSETQHPVTPTPVTLDDVRARLPDGRTALVQYATGPNQTPTTAFVVAADTVFAVVLPSHDSLRPAIEDLLAGVQAGQRPDHLARMLGRQVIDPVLALLPAEIDRLLLVPDGALYRLPFAALRIEGDVYAIERFSLTYAPSGTLALRSRVRGHRGPVRLLAVGDPAYGSGESDEAVSFRAAFDEAGGLPRIRSSGREARRVARYADESDVYTRDEATESVLKRLDLSEYDVLHLATHALVDEGTVLRTSLALAPGAGEDGFLGVGELAELAIDADLVVLSGCRTAGGRLIAGEGLMGLSGPLLSAGAGVVVGTQWAVEDRAVRTYVIDLYDRLADGETIADALRMAQLEGLERGDPPRDWAVFAATGDPTVRLALERPPWWKFW